MKEGVVVLRPSVYRDTRIARRLTDKQAIAFAAARKTVSGCRFHRRGSACANLLSAAWIHPVERELLPELPF